MLPVLPPCVCVAKHSKMEGVRKKKRNFIRNLAASVVILLEDDDLGLIVKPRRTPRFWQRPWLKEREDQTQMNTIMKLQNQLLKVSRT